MTKLDLIAAIGAARDEDLEHSERLVSRKHRVKIRILMAAAIIALLSFTAFAAPAIWNALFGVTAEEFRVSRIFVEKGQPIDVRESSLNISLDVQMSEDAPSRLATCYVPMLPAEQMEPIPLTVMKGAVVNFRTDSLLQWKNEDGEYVLFRQVAWPDYAKGQTFDTVSTGFDADYSITQTELGGYIVQRLVVEPSEKDENGVHAEHPGLQKLYWSDGFYLFSMEVNYSMEDARLEEILKSIQPVSDATKYVVTEEQATSSPEPRSSLILDRILFPETIPQGYVQSCGSRDGNGEYLFLWLKEGPHQPTVLELSISMEGRNSWIKKDWETLNRSYEKAERDVNGSPVICYESDWASQLLWQFDGADYTLCSVGPERFPVEELVTIMTGLIPVEDIDAVLMN